MTTKKIAAALEISIRHACRLKAARDPRVVELEKSDISDIPEEVWRQVERDLAQTDLTKESS